MVPDPELLVVLVPRGSGWVRWLVTIRGEELGELPDRAAAMAAVDDAMGEPIHWTRDPDGTLRGWSHAWPG